MNKNHNINGYISHNHSYISTHVAVSNVASAISLLLTLLLRVRV